MKEKHLSHSPQVYHHIDTDLAFRNFFETAPMMMGIVDLEGEEIRHVADNEAVARFFDIPTHSSRGKLASEIGVPAETIRTWTQFYQEAARTNGPVSFQYEHQNNEEIRYLSVTVSPMGLNGEGNPRFSYIAQDVTDDFRAELTIKEELHTSEERYRSVVENMSEGLVLFDSEMNLTYQNPASLKIHGYQGNETGDVDHKKLPGTWEAWELNGRKINFDEWPVSRVFQGERFQGQVIRVRRVDDGHEFYGSYNGCPIRNSDGKIVMAFITIREISAEVRVQELLQSSEEKFREIANALPLIIWVSRPDGFVDWYSDWYYRYTGLAKGQDKWDGEGISPIHPDDMATITEKWSASLQTGEPTHLEFRIRRASDGMYRWHLSRGVAVKNEEGKIIKWIGSNTDIHDTKMLLEKLELEQSTREQFVASLSHDLRTPLTAAKISAQVISRKIADADVVNRSAVRIVDNMNRADSMIRDLLDVSRVRAGEKISLELENCDLNKIISETLEDLSTVHGDRFVFHSPGTLKGPWSCNGIRRIIENLCSNAIKYGSEQTAVKVSVTQDASWVNLCIHNDGQAIPQHELGTLFEPFRRVESIINSGKKGWGLGLTLVRGLAEAHGGGVRVESDAEKGTTFIVNLPR